MTQLSSGLPVAAGTGFLFSPASRYPTPTAFLVDAGGTTLHSWSHRAWQPHPREEPPNYLRGWNHVAVDGAGSLYAIVPLRALLKLTFQSTVDWSCSVTAHHDLAFDSGGNILVLTEAPRRVRAGGRQQVVLDDLVTTIGPDGRWLREQSLYDILRTEPGLRRRIDAALVDRAAALEREWGTGSADRAMSAAAESWPAPGGDGGDQRRRTLQALRALPGSPCDVLHANTLDILGAHPDGSWDDGAVLVCLRELDTVAVLDLARAQVRWSWGAGELSGPHEPSVLPDGRVLVFDNGVRYRRSRVVLVDPGRDEVSWSWTAQPPESFFCPLAGGCERLGNGNLLVTDSTRGAAFELGWDGRVRWRLALPPEVYGAERGRVSIYRMSAVPPELTARLAAPGAECR